MKLLKRLLTFISIIALYLIIKEFIFLFNLLNEINTVLAYIVILLIFAFIIYYAIIPLYKIVKIPTNPGPTKDPSKVDELRRIRIESFKSNEYLIDSGYAVSNLQNNETTYNEITKVLSKECNAIRKKYVNSLFYSSSVAQNGFLDAVLILSTSVNLIKEIFILYNGRVNNRDLFKIAKKVYYSILIGGSEGAEYAAEEIFSKLATDTVKSIPFLDKIFSSLADGFINAALLTRISIVTENYCTMLYIKDDKELYPSVQSVTSTVKNLTSGAFKKINENLIKLGKEKAGTLVERALNPVKLVFEKSKTVFESPNQINKKVNIHKKLSKLFQQS